MSQYSAKLSDTLTFELIKNEKIIGKLKYAKWFSFSVNLEIESSSEFKIEPTGFWGTTMELKDNCKVLLKFQMNWKGEIVVQSFLDNIENGFILKNIGILNDSIILIDKDGLELMTIEPHYKWKYMNYEYKINTTEIFDIKTNQDILLLAAIHCANHFLIDGI
jgi:hypothetical protein